MYHLQQAAARESRIYDMLREKFLKGEYQDPITKTQYIKADTISQSSLRAELDLSNNKRDYVFEYGNVLTPSTEDQQNGLNVNDVFCVTDFGMFLTAIGGSTTISGTVVTPRPTIPQLAPLNTYPDPVQFAQAGNQHLGLEALYHSVLEAEINNTKYVERFPLLNCRRVPEFQNSFTASGNSGDDGFDFSRFAINAREPGDGFIPMTPNMYLWGISKNKLTVRLPDASNVQPDNPLTEKNRLVVILLGYLIAGTARRRS